MLCFYRSLLILHFVCYLYFVFLLLPTWRSKPDIKPDYVIPVLPVRSLTVIYIFISPKKWYSKNTYNIINKENTISKHKVNTTIISLVKNMTIKLQSILK